MLNLAPNFSDRLLDLLLAIPALQNQENRNLLLRHLPNGPVSAISRSTTPVTDLHNIEQAVSSWGQLDSGEWALVILAKNALRFAQDTEPGRELQALLAELETQRSDSSLSLIEEIVIGYDERLPSAFLEQGLIASRSVAKLVVPRIIDRVSQTGYGTGTGWMIGDALFITNYHVIEVRDRDSEPPASQEDLKAQALAATAWFDYDDWDRAHVDYRCIELMHADSQLDYAILRLSSQSLTGNSFLSERRCLTVCQAPPTMQKGNRLNIIQHPQGGPKRFAIRSNFFMDRMSTPNSPHRIRYLTDTEPGSSGSPVLNDEWQVIALHHAAVSVPEAKYKGETIKYNNQGVDICAILDNLPDAVRNEIHEAQR